MNPHPAPRTPHPSSWGLYVVTDRSLTGGRPLEAVVDAALQGGAKAIQLREKDLSARALYELAQRLLPIVHSRGAALLVNDRIDLALALLPIDGVHLAQTSLPPAEARGLLGPGRLIGVSCHTADEAIEAQNGADFIVVGPLFSTPSKAAYGPPVGIERLREVRRRVRLPILGIGGITASNAAQVIEAGADGVAAISAVMAADDPAGGARHILRAVEPALAARIGGMEPL